MTDVQRSALKRALISAAVMAPVFGYLWMVDYRGLVMPEHGTTFCVALLSPPFLVIVRSVKQIFSVQA